MSRIRVAILADFRLIPLAKKLSDAATDKVALDCRNMRLSFRNAGI